MNVTHRFPRRLPLALGLTLIVLGSISLDAAEAFFQFKTQPQFKLSSALTLADTSTQSKLSPDLRAARNSGADFAGVNREGAIFRVASAASLPGIRLKLASMSAVLPGEFPNISAEKVPAVAKLIVELQHVPEGRMLGKYEIVDRYDKRGLALLSKAHGFTAADIDALAASGNVRYIEPNYLYSIDPPPMGSPTNPAATPAITPTPNAFPSDPYYANQSQWGPVCINMVPLWLKSAAASDDIVVGLIDSGVDTGHEDLQGRLVEGYNGFDQSNHVTDGFGHGTHCAGIIAAMGNNGLGIAGMGWKTRIMPVKVFDDFGSPAESFQLARAIDQATAHGVRILNLSWGGPQLDEQVRKSLVAADAVGVIIVVAAGNTFWGGVDTDATPNYPACLTLDLLISVMSIDRDLRPSTWSNHGAKSITLAAPGGAIWSTYPVARGSYQKLDGTSMAAPHVSGFVAAIWALEQGRDRAAALRVRDHLLRMVKPDPDLVGMCRTAGYLHYDDVLFASLTGIAPSGVTTAPPGGSAPPLPGPSSVAPSRPPVQTMSVEGVIENGAVAMGGETTGTLLRGGTAGNYELKGATEQIERELKKSSGKAVRVSGALIPVPAVEQPDRKVLLIDSMEIKANQ